MMKNMQNQFPVRTTKNSLQAGKDRSPARASSLPDSSQNDREIETRDVDLINFGPDPGFSTRSQEVNSCGPPCAIKAHLLEVTPLWFSYLRARF